MLFIFVRLVPDPINDRCNHGVRKSTPGEEIAQFLAELVPFQTFKSGCPFLGCFISERFVIHAFHSGGNSLIGQSLLAKFHRHQPPAARAKRSSVFHPRTSKLIVIGKPVPSQPLESLLDDRLRRSEEHTSELQSL